MRLKVGGLSEEMEFEVPLEGFRLLGARETGGCQAMQGETESRSVGIRMT